MLMFVSDLHLTDDDKRRSFEISAFVSAIKSRVERGVIDREGKKLVLLGDIFELLKSDVWIQKDIRPWSPSGSDLAEAAIAVLDGIEKNNRSFFDSLQELRTGLGVDLDYLPGNHDGIVADMAVPGVRQRVRELIPGIPGANDEKFESTLVDFDHGVVAEHGHQLDPFNQPVKTTRFVPGDAVVVEVLVQLPRRTATNLGSAKGSEGIDQFQERLLFLQELDNVLPQDLSGMMRWLEFRVDGLPHAQRNKIEAAISTAVRQCCEELRSAMKAHKASKFERRVIGALTSHKIFTKASWLRRFAKLPIVAADQSSSIAKRLGTYGPLATPKARSLDLYVAGHTHATLQQEFVLGAGRRMTYLNTGTWRRVQTPARSLSGINFQKYYEETLLCVNRLENRERHGRYEFLRYVRGV
jgi:UDP-2,3-diacylglucosamine pyrophosphatase LpxH